MKYCSPCRLRARDEDETCSRCGGALRSMGGGGQPRRPLASSAAAKQKYDGPSGPSRAQDAPAHGTARKGHPTEGAERAKPKRETSKKPESETGDMQFQLAGLESQVKKSSRRVRILAALAAVLVLSFGGLMWYLRHSYIMQFAEIDQLEITRSQLHTGSARIRFRPLTAGRIQLVRTGAGRQKTLLEYAAGPALEGEFKEFNWTGDADDTWSISIRYRDGGDLVDREWRSSEFDSDGPGVLVSATL